MTFFDKMGEGASQWKQGAIAAKKEAERRAAQGQASWEEGKRAHAQRTKELSPRPRDYH